MKTENKKRQTTKAYGKVKVLTKPVRIHGYDTKTDAVIVLEDAEDAELTLAHGITYKKPAADLEDMEDMSYEYDAEDAEDAEETKKSHWTYDYRPLKKRYTNAAVEAAEAVLKEWNVSVKYTGCGNYRKIEDICNAAAEAQNGFVSFPIVCGIENNATYHAF